MILNCKFMLKSIRLLTFLLGCSLSLARCLPASADYADKVDMLMGNRGSSNCVIGPQLPHGSVNPSPQTPEGENDGYDPGQPIRGFGQLHVSGTGWGRYGQILLSPQRGFDPSEQGHDSPKSAEIATPYFYGVNLDRYGIRAEVTPTHHCAAYRFTYAGGDDVNILLDVAHSIPQHIKPEIGGKFHGGAVSYDRQTRMLSGWGAYSGGFGSEKPYKVYFAIACGAAPREVEITDRGDSALYARIGLPGDEREFRLNVGISLRSEANARSFLEEEIGSADFGQVMHAAREAWNKVLSGIEVKGGSEQQQRIFYTALYHSFLMPRLRTGDNPGWESGEPHLDDHYCIWDTWRTKYPLMVLLQESYVSATVRSFVDRYEHNGMCRPTFTSSLDSDRKQGGDDVDNVIADAFAKGVSGFDRQKAWELLRHNALSERSPEYLRLGWQPETGDPMSCSYGVEFAYNDFCASCVAEAVGDTVLAAELRRRSESWERLFDPALEEHGFTGFLAPRREDGSRIAIVPSRGYGSWVEYFYEGNSWVYTLFVPHQIGKLIEKCGGRDAMVRRLCYGFDHRLVDLGNEPGFLAPFLFTHCGRPDLTAHYVSEIRRGSFSLEKGYPDNEDSGAMGAWYVFASIGLFPNAGQDFYYLLPPAFERITLTMENGRKLDIRTRGFSEEAPYVASVTLNGKKLDRAWIRHSEIADGAQIVFTMSARKGDWGRSGYDEINGMP